MATNTVTITVDPTTAGGTATGGGNVCYGTNSTLLTLTIQVGSVVKWQSKSFIGSPTWTDIPESDSATYTATNLTSNTWFRAVVKSGTCLTEHSQPTSITMFINYYINGYVKYDNNPKTPLNGLKIILKRNSTILVDSVVTASNGFYQFTGLASGTYGLQIKSSHPSGQWQTWSGVNNTDYLLALRHATTGPLLAANPPVVRISGDVKAPQTPPVITTVDAEAIRMAAKYGWGNPPYFQILKWVFSGVTTETPIDNIAVNCVNVTRDIRGLCAGDVNGSYLPPNGHKIAEPSLELVNRGTLPITPEITFPIRADRDMELGAITLKLNYDTALIEITGVEMPDNGGEEPYFVLRRSSFVLEIGWMSLNPINVVDGQTVLMIHAKVKSTKYEVRSTKYGEPIRFTLNDDPLSELADGDGNVLSDARLSVADAGVEVQGSKFNETASVVVYPLPAKDVLNVEFVIGNSVNNNVSLQMYTMQGILVLTQNVHQPKQGLNKTTLDLRDLPNGAYMLKVTVGDKTDIKKVIVNR